VLHRKQRQWYSRSLEVAVLALIAVTPDASRAYSELVALRMLGPLNKRGLGRALGQLVNRHESLRAGSSADEKCQRILPRVDIKLRLETDLSGAASPEAARQPQAVMENETQQVFELDQAPLARARLIQLGETEHILCFTVHHLVTDGWSFGVLLEELGRLYTAESTGVPADLSRAGPNQRFCSHVP